MEPPIFEPLLRSLPSEVDAQAIRREWQALKPPYEIGARELPMPAWTRRDLAEDGEQAWSILQREVERISPARPLCLYIHIPFCASRCSFCDCYSFPVGRQALRHVEAYLDRLRQEMRVWGRLSALTRRPVSTVHLGGGTPAFIGQKALCDLVAACRDQFGVSPRTEWALESTTSDLSDEVLGCLNALGFSRLHIGVQSLQDNVRRLINRRETSAQVIGKIDRALALGWVVSVDLIYGLPEQSLAGFLEDVETLAAAGVDGLSLYELQLSPRNRPFAERHTLTGGDRLANYMMLQAVIRRLEALSYRPIAFNHFSRSRDTDLYFTFPERGEDCLALGTIADGVLNDYHFRHPPYKSYCERVDESLPGLQGGLRRTELENRLHPLEVAIMSARLPFERFADSLGWQAAESLFQRWRASALIREDAQSGHFCLTANGSWFAAQMMGECQHMAGY